MFNRNSIKTSLMFLAIIFIVVIIRTFFIEDNVFVKTDNSRETASISCLLGYKVC